jgi:hypothetical protein
MPERDAKTGERAARLSRSETHDLSMIIKDRAKVLKAHIEEQAARFTAEFEQQVSSVYAFDQEQIWAEATQRAQAEVAAANEKIMKHCKELGIPAQFAPGLTLSWHGRGQNMLEYRRAELRSAAKAKIAAMTRIAQTKIEQQSLDLRTQVVAMGVVSPDARLFLESLAPVTETMKALSVNDIMKELETRERQSPQRRIGGYDQL